MVHVGASDCCPSQFSSPQPGLAREARGLRRRTAAERSQRVPCLGSRCLPAGLRIPEASTKVSAFRSTSAHPPSQTATLDRYAASLYPSSSQISPKLEPIPKKNCSASRTRRRCIATCLASGPVCPRPVTRSESRNCVPWVSRLLDSQPVESFSEAAARSMTVSQSLASGLA